MATQIEMVNRVLRRLREDTVDTVNENSYSTLVAEFLNAAIEEVTRAHDWRRMIRQAYASVGQYSAVGWGSSILSDDEDGSGQIKSGYTVLTERSKLTWLNHDVPMFLYSPEDYTDTLLTDGNEWTLLTPMTYDQFQAAMKIGDVRFKDPVHIPTHVTFHQSTNVVTGATTYFSYLYPLVEEGGTLYFHHWTPPAELALDDSDAGVIITAPEKPVFEYTLMLALNERGEEIGEPGNVAERRYYEALARAIEDDIDFDQRSNKFDWRRD